MTTPPITLPLTYTALNSAWKTIRTSPHPAEPSIIVLTLHRPAQHNAFTETMRAELEAAYAMFDADERVRCVVVTGSGRMFCAGADLEVGFGAGGEGEGESGGEHRDGWVSLCVGWDGMERRAWLTHPDRGGRAVLAIHHCRKPSIAALNGSAVGVGITLTLPCAIRIAYRDAKIGFVFARRGIVMEAASSFFLPRLIGYSRALQAVTTGMVYRASDRVYDGLFAELCDRPEDVLPKALEVAVEVVRNTSTVSTYLMREMMYRNAGSAEGQHLVDSRILHDLFSSPDCSEGVKSFMEKRPAEFTGTMENTKVTSYPWWMPIDTLGRAKVSPVGGPKL